MFNKKSNISKLSKNEKKLLKYLPVVIIFFILLMFGLGYSKNDIEVSQENLKINGIYGETIPLKEIEKIKIVDKLPTIDYRSNGFSSGKQKKGYFILESGEKIKLFSNSNTTEFILIEKKKGHNVYISTHYLSDPKEIDRIITLPNNGYHASGRSLK